MSFWYRVNRWADMVMRGLVIPLIAAFVILAAFNGIVQLNPEDRHAWGIVVSTVICFAGMFVAAYMIVIENSYLSGVTPMTRKQYLLINARQSGARLFGQLVAVPVFMLAFFLFFTWQGESPPFTGISAVTLVNLVLFQYAMALTEIQMRSEGYSGISAVLFPLRNIIIRNPGAMVSGAIFTGIGLRVVEGFQPGTFHFLVDSVNGLFQGVADLGIIGQLAVYIVSPASAMLNADGESVAPFIFMTASGAFILYAGARMTALIRTDDSLLDQHEFEQWTHDRAELEWHDEQEQEQFEKDKEEHLQGVIRLDLDSPAAEISDTLESSPTPLVDHGDSYDLTVPAEELLARHHYIHRASTATTERWRQNPFASVVIGVLIIGIGLVLRQWVIERASEGIMILGIFGAWISALFIQGTMGLETVKMRAFYAGYPVHWRRYFLQRTRSSITFLLPLDIALALVFAGCLTSAYLAVPIVFSYLLFARVYGVLRSLSLCVRAEPDVFGDIFASLLYTSAVTRLRRLMLTVHFFILMIAMVMAIEPRSDAIHLALALPVPMLFTTVVFGAALLLRDRKIWFLRRGGL